MYRLSIKRSRKPEYALSREHHRRLQRIQETARRERQQQLEDSILHALESTNADTCNSTFVEAEPSTRDDCRAQSKTAQYQCTDTNHCTNSINEDGHFIEPNPAGANFETNAPIDLNSLNVADQLNEPNEIAGFVCDLARAFVNSSMTHQQSNAILRVIRTHSCLASLPKDSRTILQTPRSSSLIHNIAGGEYLHIGIKNGILSILRETSANLIPNKFLIDFHTDGATLDAQGKIQMWPIQIRIANIPYSKPEIVGIWRGSSKPTDCNEFLKSFIDEFLELSNLGGVSYGEILYSIEIRCFIADAPARAFILAHAGHKSISPCSKCWVQGESLRQGVIAFRGVDHRARTNQEYAYRIDGDHHSEHTTPLYRLPMNLIVQVVFEYMHLVCLGIMKKIFSVIIEGKYAYHLKLNRHLIRTLSARLALVKIYCPRDFARKPEDVTKFSQFKATEFRQILLYTGPVILYGIVNDAVYFHFLIFHTAMRILVNPSSSGENITFAEGLLRIFVQNAEQIYGLEFLTYVVHCLLHLADDVKRFGPLDSYSAFPYESNMMYFRNACRKPHQHLQQIANRRVEKNRVSFKANVIDESMMVPGKPWRGVLPSTISSNHHQYQSLKCKSFFVSLNNQDDTLMLQDSTICVLQNIIVMDNEYFFIVKKFHRAEDFFDVGYPSSLIGMFRCSVLLNELHIVNINQIRGKCFRMPYWHDQFMEPIPDIFVVGLLSSTSQ